MSDQSPVGAPDPAAGEVLSTGGAPATVDVVPGSDTPGGSTRRRWLVAGGAATVLVLSAAGIALASLLAGGGTQPEDLVPADAVAFADIDLDPSAGQKVEIIRFLQKFPETRDRLGDGDDLRRAVVETLLDGAPVGYEEVEAWLGSRYGVALLPGGTPEESRVQLLLQTTDEAAARTTLERLVTAPGSFVVADGYAVVLPLSADAETVVADAAASSLAGSPGYTAAMAPLGDGVAALYVDTAQVDDSMLVGPLGATTPELPDAQFGAVVRFSSDAVELVGGGTSAELPAPAPPTALIDGLPESTVFAFAGSGAGANFLDQWNQVQEQLERAVPGGVDREVAQLRRQLGIELPADVVTLLGDDMVLAVDGEDLTSFVPSLGLRSVTDPVAGADLASRLQPVLDELTAGLGVVARPTADGLVVATSPGYADRLAAQDGGLGQRADFTAALPDASSAQFAVWLDFARLADVAALAAPDAADALGPLQALGLTVRQSQDRIDVRARLTVG